MFPIKNGAQQVATVSEGRTRLFGNYKPRGTTIPGGLGPSLMAIKRGVLGPGRVRGYGVVKPGRLTGNREAEKAG